MNTLLPCLETMLICLGIPINRQICYTAVVSKYSIRCKFFILLSRREENAFGLVLNLWIILKKIQFHRSYILFQRIFFFVKKKKTSSRINKKRRRLQSFELCYNLAETPCCKLGRFSEYDYNINCFCLLSPMMLD